MKRIFVFISFVSLFFVEVSFGQTNDITINAKLDVEKFEIQIQQEIRYYNNTETVLDTIYLHNWANSFKDNDTPLSKRLIENYNKDLYFAKDKNRGHTTINNITVNYSSVSWGSSDLSPDIIAIPLEESLSPHEAIIINATYTVRVPIEKFTKYGRNEEAYNLRYWYLVPAFYDGEWKLMSNLDTDDLFMDLSDYNINFTIPEEYVLNTDLSSTMTKSNGQSTYELHGKNRIDIELNITKLDDFNIFKTTSLTVVTNLNSELLEPAVKTSILNREIAFIHKYLGYYPHDSIFINKITYSKNPVYGLNQLPKFLTPFSDVFEWDIKMFKALTRKYIDNTILVNHREDMWLIDGIQNYLMMKYVSDFYPEIKATGNISKIWGFRSFNLAKLNFNDKYPFVYQFAARKNIDQALTTRADSLSNFNRQIVNKYKAGLGLRYLEEYLGGDIIHLKIRQFYKENTLKYTHSDKFRDLVVKETDEDLSWFFEDYIKSKKKIDYTIKGIDIQSDTIAVTIVNKRDISAPVALYGIKDKEIHFKKWFSNIDSIATVKIPSNGYDRLSLNYEYLYPELNLRDNWKSTKKRMFNRPIQFKFWKDVEDPYYNQIYYTPEVRYNYYDGLQLGLSLSNKTMLRKNFVYKATPFYGFKSKDLTGSFSTLYEFLPDASNVYKYYGGMGGSFFHFAPDLAYRKLTPYAGIQFKRKSLRDVGGSSIGVGLVMVDRDFDPNAATQNPESNKYNVFNIAYSYSKPEIIQDFRYTTSLEIESKFTKIALDMRYRRLTDANRQLDFRLFVGTFLRNKTESDFFSFGLSQQSDYLFRLNYFGRSEDSGFFSQQYITSEGGFKSFLPENYANQWMATFNSSIGIWRWIEIYNDIGFLKNKNQSVYFAYENGVRLNFIHEILEVYFPLYSNNGWEIAQESYSSRIRFVLVLNPRRIVNFIRRGFY